MSENVSLKINNMPVTVPAGTTIMEAARQLKIRVPALCHHPDLCLLGNCRICVVEVSGMPALQASCCTPVMEGTEVLTHSAAVRLARRHMISLLLSEHDNDCLRCVKNGHCELQTLAAEFDVDGDEFISVLRKAAVDTSSPSIRRDPGKCIRCQRCVRTCTDLQAVSALAVAHKGANMCVTTFMDKPLHAVVCTNCGQCVNRCPTGALTECDAIHDVWKALEDPDKFVVVQTAPAVRVGLGEYLGYAPGARLTGKMVSSLRYLGFDAVFDTNFTADLTIVEEGHELLSRLKQTLVEKRDVHLPMFTSCSPGWIKYVEHEFPELLPNLSTCKSPQQMFGPLAKQYFARQAGIDPARMSVVSVMPCTAKKFECRRPEMQTSGYPDVDYVLTTRELCRMIEQAGVQFQELPDSRCDSMLGRHTGAAVIFGATGGVMEAALRTVYEIVTGRDVPFENLNIEPVRGMEGVKEAAIRLEECLPDWQFLEGVDVKVAIAHGLVNARKVCAAVVEGGAPWHFIEVMACPGGCLGGGGQPLPTSLDIRQRRMQAIYAEDMAWGGGEWLGKTPGRASRTKTPRFSTSMPLFWGNPAAADLTSFCTRTIPREGNTELDAPAYRRVYSQHTETTRKGRRT